MANKPNNPCPIDVFIRKLAQELDVSLEVARHIYETFTVTSIELLEEYDSVKPVVFVHVDRAMTNSVKKYNPNTQEVEMTEPKDRIKAYVTRSYKDYDKTHELVDRRNEKLERQEIRKAQIEQENEERRKEIEEYKRKTRKAKRRRTRYRKMKDRQRQRAIERLIEEEMRIELEEKRQYEKDLRRRLKK